MSQNKRRILIVDDSPINVDILTELLEDQYELVSAASGEECLSILPQFAPDIVLLDIMMPGIDGYEACRRIKASPVGPFTQVILVSGKGSTQERLEGYQAGADDYIVKPFDHDELLAKLRVQLRLRTAVEKLWHANAQVRAFNEQLEQMVEARTAEVVATRDLLIFSLAQLADSRDPETGDHLDECGIIRRSWPKSFLNADRTPSSWTRNSSKTSFDPRPCTTSARWASQTQSCSSRAGSPTRNTRL